MKNWESIDDLIKFMREKYNDINFFNITSVKKFIIFKRKEEDKTFYCIAKKPSKLKVDEVNTWNLAKICWPEFFSKQTMFKNSMAQLQRIIELQKGK